MLKNKIIVKKIRNIFILLMAIIIMLGAYQNIRNSKAENVIQIEMEVSDKSNILSAQTITVDATETSDGNYLLTLPTSVNKNIVTKYYTSSGEEILVDADNNISTIQLTEEEVANKKVQVQSDYDTKEVTVNNQTKLLYNKELQELPNESGTGSQDVIVTGYMPLDVDIEVKEMDLATLTSVKLPSENQTMQKAYEISIFEVVEKQGTETNTTNEVQTQTMEDGAQNTDSTQQNVATQADVEPQSEVAEQATTQTENTETERVEYDSSVYGEKITVKTKQEQTNAIKTYTLAGDNQVTEVANVTSGEYVDFESDKGDKTLKYIIATQENEAEENISLMSEDINSDIATYASSSSTLKSASSETSASSAFLGSTNIQRQNIESVTFNSTTTDATMPKGLIRNFDGGSYSGTKWTDLTKNKNGVVKGGSFRSDGNGNYLSLNGTSSQWVNLGRMEMFLKEQVTLDVIIKVSDLTQTSVILGNVDDGGMEIALNAGKPRFSIWFENDTSYTRIDASSTIGANKSTRITGTYNGTTMALYVDGVQVGTKTKQNGIIHSPLNDTVMAIGCNPIGSSSQQNYFKGKIYSVKMYNKGLTGGEIAKGWNSSEQGVLCGLIRAMDAFYNVKGEGHKRNATTWYDLTGNQNGAIMNGAQTAHTASTVNGRWGNNYFEFNGSTDWVNLGQIDTSITNKITLDAIVEVSDNTQTYGIVSNLDKGGVEICLSEGKPRLNLWFEGDTGYTRITDTKEIAENTPTRITGTFDGTTMALYVNGELVGTVTKQNGTIHKPVNNTVMAIGCNPTGSSGQGYYLKGKVYSAKVYNKGLSQSQIQQVWDVSSAGDYSILAWRTQTGPYQVNIGSNNEIYANSNSSYLFSNIGSGDKCTATSVIDGLGTLNTSNVTNMNYMFQNCGSKSMTKLFLGPSFDTSSVTSMTGMFQNCGSTSMTQLDLGPAFKKIASSNSNFVANCGKSGAVIYVSSEIFQDIKHFKLSQNSGTTVGYTNGTISPRTTLKSTSSETNATSGFLGNTSIQRQNVQSVKFSSNTSGAAKVSSSKGLVRSFDGYKNTGAGDENAHSTSTTTWKNLSGTSNGAVNGGATWGQNYLSLDGVNDWVDLGQISLTNQVTLDTIVEINSASSEKQAILGNPQNGGVLLQIFEQKVYFWAWINGQSYYTIINSDTELTLGKPTRITGTFNGSKMCLYINGKLEASKSVSGTILAPGENTPMAIGSNRKGTGTSGNGEFAKANIYSAKVYTQALTQSEIQQVWDVSELGDYSIMAWYDASSSPYTVNIASSFDMYANANSSYLFSYIGYGSSCTATNVIDKMNLLNTQCVTNMRGMFQYCGYRKMTSFSLGNKFDTSNVTNMNSMFMSCGYTAMTSLDLGDKFDTSNVTNMNSMFMSCGYTAMTSLDLGDKFDTNNVTDMVGMFYNCGTTAMTSLDLGPAFTRIASSYDDFATNCGKSGSITIYTGSAIYSNSNAFRLGANSSVTIGFSRGTINPKYRPEWSIQSYSVSGSSLVVTLQGNVNTANYTGDSLKTVTNRFTNGSTNLVRVNVDGDSSANSTITKTISNASSTTAQTVTCTLTLGNFAESARQSGKNFLEWSGNVLLDYIPTTIEDAYGNPNIAESDGTTMFTDTIKPEFTYEYTNTTIDHGTKTVTIVFDVADKYFSSSALSTDSSASNIDVVVGGVTATNATKTLTKIEDLSTTINGTSKKTGERYRLVITNLDQGEGNDYSGIMTLAFPADIVTDTSSNGNVAKTITVGIDAPTNGDGHDSGVIVDVVDPIWKIANINIDKTNKKVTADLIATDKYLTGVENSTLTTSDITISVDGDTNANTVITKSLTEPTFFSNAITGMKEIKYTLTLTNFEEATRQTGKSFLEYSGAVKITVAAGTITDVPSETGGSSQTQSNSSKEQEFQLGQVDFLKPRFIYEYANTTINHETKTVTVVFDATDKYFNSSALSTDTTASNITVIVDGTTATNATKTLTKLQDITETVNGTSKKVGEKYQLVISNLDQGDGGSYSGVMTLVFPENIVTDTEANGNLAKTITIGIDDPTTGDGHDTGIIVDVVDPIWKVENINIDKTNKKVTADLIATDKYLTGVENSTLTTSDITVSVDGDANANTVIAKSLSTPTFSTNETTGLKEIKYALTLNNFEEATKQTGKSFLEYSGTVKITVAAGTITDDTSGEGGGNGVRPSVMFDANGTNTDGLHIGDFVNYDAGTWTQEEINAIQTGLASSTITANGSTSLPSSNFQFGGFTAGASRNENATPYKDIFGRSFDYIKDETGNAVTGWRVFDIEGDNVTLISVGCPEDYYRSNGNDSGYINEYILTGNVNSNWSGADTSAYQKRNWSNYVNLGQKAISATVLTKSKLDSWYSKYITAGADTYNDTTFQQIYTEPYIKFQSIVDSYSNYTFSEADMHNSVYYFSPNSRLVTGNSGNDYVAKGVRVLVSLSSDVLFNSQKTGTKTLTSGNMATYGGNQTYNCWAIAEGSSSGTTDGQSNTSKEQEFELGHVDFIKPRIEKESATKDETAKTETIILNVMDKYLDTTDALENSEITVYIDGENVTGLTKTLSKNTRTTATTSGGVTYETNGDITAIVNGTSQIVGQQYKLVLSDFEQATNNSKKYKDWSGTVSIDVAEGAVKDQISASTANTSDEVTVKGDFVDFIAPYLTYQYLTTDIDREGTDADGKSFQMAFEVTDKYYESGKLSIDDLSIQMADGKHTYDLKNTPVTITLNSDESITAPNVKMTNKTTGEVETVTSTTIGHRYVLTISNLEQLEIAEGNTTLDYSGIVTVSVDANKISDRSGNKNIAKTITSGVSIPDETGDGVVVDVVKPIWRRTTGGSLDLTTKTASLVVKGTDTYYASNSLTAGKIKVYAYTGTTPTDITSLVSPALSTATRLDESVTVDGVTSTRQYGVQYTITLTGIPIDKDQVKVVIPAGTLTDQSGNTNEEYETRLFTTLKSTAGETAATSAFLGNSSIQRQNIESVTFVSGIEGAANNKWDVSAAQDGSIWAWYTGSGPYQVYIGSDEFMCANQDSRYLFSYIGYASNSTATNVINGLEYLNIITATNMSYMFNYCGYQKMTSLNLGNNFDTTNVTNMAGMFQNCGQTKMTSINLGTQFYTSKVTDMSNMFNGCGQTELITFSLGSNFDTTKVTNMSGMFQNFAHKLGILNLGTQFYTSEVTDMSNMFNGCGQNAMTTLTLGTNFDTTKVTNMSQMFKDFAKSSTGMTSLDLGDSFYTTSVTDMTRMFNGCGQTAMVALDLGPAFTKIASDENSGFMTNCGTTGAVIYAPEAIYKDRTSFKLNSGDTSTASGAIPVDAGRTINPIYKPEWEKVSSSLDTTTNPENPTVSVVVKGSANKSETINGVNINYNSQVTSGLTKDNISVYIDGELDGDTNKNGKIDAGETPSITKTVTSASPSATSAEVTHTITLSGLEEALRQNGKSFKEWSGNIAIKIGGRGEATDTYTANVLTDEYGNQSMMETDASGTWIDVLYKDTDTDHNVNGTMFADFVKPEFTYEYSNTTINHETKTVTIVFDVTDKYFNSSALLTDTTASNIDVVVGGTTPTNATKALTKLQDLTATVNGTSKKVGERYQLVITNLDQGGGNDYSGIMTLAFPADIITDMSTNGNLAKTITIGIDDPTTGDGDDTGVIVDVVDPIWKVENINIDKTNKKVTADLIATDKYLTGVENSTLTTGDITVSVDDDVNANTVITKSLTEPTFSTNETTGMKEIKYTLTLDNFEQATKQTGKSFLEYSGTVKITVAAGTVRDDASDPNSVSPSVLFDAAGTNANGLHIGDFVNYDAGTWTQEEINGIQTGLKANLQTANGSTSLPSNVFQFGGFAAGTSRNGNATPYNSSYNYIKDETENAVTGWRVFDIEGDTVTLISAGNPEDYYHFASTNNGYISEYILTGNVNTSWRGADTSIYQKRNWSNYVNVGQKAISATLLTKSEIDRWYSKYTDAGSSANTYSDDIFQKIYSEPYIKYQSIFDNFSYYWLGDTLSNTNIFLNSLTIEDRSLNRGKYESARYGVRILVSLSSDVLFNSQKTGTKTLSGGNMDTYGGAQTYNCWAISEGAGTRTDGHSNTNKEKTFELGHVDFIKPRIEKQSATKDETAKTETIIINVIDKYIDTTKEITADEITIYADEEIVTGITKTLSKNTRTTPATEEDLRYETNGNITTTINGTSKVIGQQYKLVLSDFEQATNNSKRYKDWSGTISIDVAEGAAKDQISGTTANTNELTTLKGDFVDFITPYLTYQYLTTDIDRTGADADGKSFQMAFEVTDKYYESGKLSIDDLSIQMADGKHTYDLKNTPVTITLNSDESITAPNVKMTNKTTGEVETVTSTTIGHRYVLTISNLEQLEIAEGNTTLDYSGIVTVSVDANKISDRSGNKNIAKTITSGVSIPDETGDGVVVDVVKPIWRRTTGGSLDLTTKTASLVVKGTDTYYASNSLTAGKIKVYAYTGTTPTDITSLVSPALSTATRLDESVTVDGVTSTRQYGVQYTITLTGIPIDKDQVKVVIPAGTLTDQSGNTNEEYETRLFTTLKSTAGETAATSAFLGNSSIQRQNIESVTFVSGIEGAANNKWDVSAAQDGSIWAWYTGSGPYQVYIGSDEFMCANQDSRYLFSYIGYASNSTATNVINGLEYLNIITATNMSYMFNYCGYQKMTSLNLGNNFDTTNVTNMAGMFQNCGQTKMTSINLGTQFYTSKVTDMSNMFNGCGQTELITFSLGSNFDTTKVTNMSGMFQNFAHKLGILNLGTQFYTSEVTDMSNMFNGCGQNAMTTLTLGTNFDTTKVTNMSQMFKDFAKSSTGMTSLDLGDSFYTTSVTDMTRMFNGCGQTAMVALDLGPAFTKIASANTDFATNCGASGIVIYAPESIYSNRTSFKLNKTGQ